MANDEQPSSDVENDPKLLSDAASDWYATFSKHLEIEFIDLASGLSHDSDVRSYQEVTVRAFIETLVESGLEFESISAFVTRYLSDGKERGPRRKFGLGKGKLVIQSEDDEHLDHFEEYLP